MNQDLDFLTKIVRALGTFEPKTFLHGVLEEIHHQAHKPGCGRMNRPWQAFVRELQDESWLDELENLCRHVLAESSLAPWPQVFLDRNLREIQILSWMPGKPTKFTQSVTAGR